MRRLILAIAVLCALGVGQTLPDSLWLRGNRAIGNDDYHLAINNYEQILRQGFEHQDLYYNLGNAYYRSGKIGLAIWAYEKGLQSNPRHADLKFNRDVVRAEIKDRIEVPRGFFMLEYYLTFRDQFTLRQMLFFGSLLLLLAGGCYALRRFDFWPRISGPISIGLTIAALLIHLVYLDKYWEISGQQTGIIINSVTEVYSTPSGLGKILFKVHEGLQVEIVRDHDDWYEIILLDGKKGWLYAGNLRLL